MKKMTKKLLLVVEEVLVRNMVAWLLRAGVIRKHWMNQENLLHLSEDHCQVHQLYRRQVSRQRGQGQRWQLQKATCLLLTNTSCLMKNLCRRSNWLAVTRRKKLHSQSSANTNYPMRWVKTSRSRPREMSMLHTSHSRQQILGSNCLQTKMSKPNTVKCDIEIAKCQAGPMSLGPACDNKTTTISDASQSNWNYSKITIGKLTQFESVSEYLLNLTLSILTQLDIVWVTVSDQGIYKRYTGMWP